MRIHRNTAALLSITGSQVHEDVAGDVYRVLPSNEDAAGDAEQSFVVYFALTQTGGASSPTVQAKLQTSVDKVLWIDLVSSTALNADGGKAETKDAAAALAPLLTYVRAITVLGGTTKPNHTADVRLLSDAPFTLKKVS